MSVWVSVSVSVSVAETVEAGRCVGVWVSVSVSASVAETVGAGRAAPTAAVVHSGCHRQYIKTLYIFAQQQCRHSTLGGG